MRTGAIFARGSCRALKWMALVGMVFALGVGQAAAQQKPNKPVLTVKGDSPTEVVLTWTMPGGGPAVTNFQTQLNTSNSFTDTVPSPVDVPDTTPSAPPVPAERPPSPWSRAR